MRMLPADGRVRVGVKGVSPSITGGARPAKGIIGDFGGVETDISTDGHDSLAGETAGRL
ncbi:MAG: DUF3416 domain-containing protein [Acidobacteriia bacterium]|nr:DUF3416 domain-containing protein [Terriglobia bacterium]